MLITNNLKQFKKNIIQLDRKSQKIGINQLTPVTGIPCKEPDLIKPKCDADDCILGKIDTGILNTFLL